ncbi:MAG: NADH-quinone oxidoreductase subunit J [Anaerolineaceae bacterium]
MWQFLILVGIALCSVKAIHSQKLLDSALWLAGASALVSILLFILGAPEIAVIELSVGAGLVTVLFVFAINITGEEPPVLTGVIPRPLSWGLVIVAAGMMAFMNLPAINRIIPIIQEADFATTLWQNRSLDMVLQAVFIFCGVLGVLGLLSESHTDPLKETLS